MTLSEIIETVNVEPYYKDEYGVIYCGHVLDVLRDMPDELVQCCVTSPPYFGLRDYGLEPIVWGGDIECQHEWNEHSRYWDNRSGSLLAEQGISDFGGRRDNRHHQTNHICRLCGAWRGSLGLEPTPELYVEHLVEIFREVRRVLRKDGTLWLNIGDSYISGKSRYESHQHTLTGKDRNDNFNQKPDLYYHPYLKDKDLSMIPARVALALQQPYYDWQIKTEAMRAWVGGIVDGEGCITILETKSSHSESLSYPPILQVRMCDLEPLDRLVRVVGSSYGKPQHPPSQAAANQRPSWQWKVVSEQAANVIAEIYPFLTCKRKQALVAWNHQVFRSARGNQGRQRGEIEKEQFCKALINQLNQCEQVDIPSWMREPSIVYEPGWYLRQDLIWSKPNPMPESVRDRCTKSHEYIFLLTKDSRYYYNQDAIRKSIKQSNAGEIRVPIRERSGAQDNDHRNYAERSYDEIKGSNRRSVWEIATEPNSLPHFATFPRKLVERCLLAGTKKGDIVLDPFGGIGTTALVAKKLYRQYILIDLSEKYCEIARDQLSNGPLLTTAKSPSTACDKESWS